MERQAVKSQDYLPAVHHWKEYTEGHSQPTVQYQAGEQEAL